MEYYGKNVCNSHFAHVSIIKRDYERNTNVIATSEDLIAVLTEGFKKKFENKALKIRNIRNQ